MISLVQYRPSDNVMFDAWFVTRGDEIHAFHLQNGSVSHPEDPNGWAIGHAVSKDGINWSPLPSLLPPLFDESCPEDFHSKFTGCAVNRGGDCYLFYTMRDKAATNQRLALAISHDWVHFERYEGNPVVVNDPETLIGFENIGKYDWNIVDCRDLVVVEAGKDEYYGYYAAAADLGGRCPVGVIAMVKSSDLLHWSKPKIVYAADHAGVLEVPDVFFLNGKWVLTCLCGMNYSGRAYSDDEYAANGTFYALSDSPEGPFVMPETNGLLLAGPVQSGFTCRSYLFPGTDRRILTYIDRPANGTAMSYPKELVLEDGILKARFFEPLADHFGEPLPLPAPAKEQNSFAWKTYGGEAKEENGTLTLVTGEKDYHAVSFPVAAPGAVIDAKIAVNAFGGGVFLRTDCPYLLLLEPEKGRVALWKLYSFEPVGIRSVNLERGKEYAVKVLLCGHVSEVYLDGVLTLQCGLPPPTVASLGIAADRGKVTARDIVIRTV